MTPGFSDDLQEVNDARKTAVIDRELSRLQMDIVALQETRLPETGSVWERETSPCSDRANHQTRSENTVRSRLLGSITPTEGPKRILSLRLQTSSGPVSLISAYAPTLASTEAYDDLIAAIRNSWQTTTVHRRRFQLQSRCRPQLLAHLLGSVRHWKNEREWPAPARALLSSWVVRK